MIDYNYHHPEWAKEDQAFITELEDQKQFFEDLSEKHAFERLGVDFSKTVSELDETINRIKRQYEQTYGKAYNGASERSKTNPVFSGPDARTTADDAT